MVCGAHYLLPIHTGSEEIMLPDSSNADNLSHIALNYCHNA